MSIHVSFGYLSLYKKQPKTNKTHEILNYDFSTNCANVGGRLSQ